MPGWAVAAAVAAAIIITRPLLLPALFTSSLVPLTFSCTTNLISLNINPPPPYLQPLPLIPRTPPIRRIPSLIMMLRLPAPAEERVRPPPAVALEAVLRGPRTSQSLPSLSPETALTPCDLMCSKSPPLPTSSIASPIMPGGGGGAFAC